MTKKLRYVFLFMTSTLVALSASIATSAEAAWQARIHASACMPLAGGGAPIDNVFGIQNDSATSALRLLCPAHDQTGQTKSSSALAVTVYDDTTVGSVVAFACGSLAFARGGSCGPTAVTGTTASSLGVALLGVSTTSVWTDEGLGVNYGYVVVDLPARQGGFRSSLQGYVQTVP